jgi:hypothetical protein
MSIPHELECQMLTWESQHTIKALMLKTIPPPVIKEQKYKYVLVVTGESKYLNSDGQIPPQKDIKFFL